MITFAYFYKTCAIAANLTKVIMYQKTIEEMHKVLLVTFTRQNFSSSTQRGYLRHFRNLQLYMEDINQMNYTQQIGYDFLMDSRHRHHSSSYQSELQSFISLLDDIVCDIPYRRCRITACVFQFPGEIGSLAKEFVERISTEQRFSSATTLMYNRVLNRFAINLYVQNVSISNLSEENICHFFTSLENIRPYIYTPIKNFLLYLYRSNLVEIDLTQRLSAYKVPRPEKLPSVYSSDEIHKMELTIEKNSRLGKRNYAMFLLASRLGLRGSDIRNLLFSSIDWDNNKIYLTQNKTSQQIELPLLKIIGEAIIDYIQHGRPVSDSKCIFLNQKGNGPVSLIRFSKIISTVITQTGIDIKSRHHGSHCLRHSLAVNLLKTGTALPVISGVLGHVSSESTMSYLKIDITGLLKCSLDVPPVPDSFYLQKGGWFYE